jgi:hypothetical protein
VNTRRHTVIVVMGGTGREIGTAATGRKCSLGGVGARNVLPPLPCTASQPQNRIRYTAGSADSGGYTVVRLDALIALGRRHTAVTASWLYRTSKEREANRWMVLT